MIALLNTIKVLFLSLKTHSPPRHHRAENSVPRSTLGAPIQLVSLGTRNAVSTSNGSSALGRSSQVQSWSSRPPNAQPSPAQSSQGPSPPTSCFKKSSFWTVLLGGLAILTGLLFFLLQWLYMNWTARKDFIEHCEGLQDTGRSLSDSCQKALKTPLASPPFSPGWRLRRYITDTTPLAVILLLDKASALRHSMLLQLCYIFLFVATITIIYHLVAYCSNMFVIYYSGIKTNSRTQIARPWDEERTLENNIPVHNIQMGYSTAVETSTSSRLRSRFHNIVADVDIASILAPETIGSRSKGVGSSSSIPRNRPHFGKRGTRRRTTLQPLSLFEDFSNLDPGMTPVHRPVSDPGRSHTGTQYPEITASSSPSGIELRTNHFSILDGPRQKTYHARLDEFNIKIDSSIINLLFAKLWGKVPPDKAMPPGILAQLLREEVRLQLMILSPPRPVGDFFLHGIHGDQFTLPNYTAHLFRLEMVGRGFKREIASITERELFVVDLLFPGKLSLLRKTVADDRHWSRRLAQYFLVVEAFKCAFTEDTRSHKLNSCPQCSSSFALWMAKLELGPAIYHRILRIGVNIPRNQWNSNQFH